MDRFWSTFVYELVASQTGMRRGRLKYNTPCQHRYAFDNARIQPFVFLSEQCFDAPRLPEWSRTTCETLFNFRLQSPIILFGVAELRRLRFPAWPRRLRNASCQYRTKALRGIGYVGGDYFIGPLFLSKIFHTQLPFYIADI